MNLNNINQFVPSMSMPSGGSNDAIKSLEQKLHQLETEKQKAIQSKDKKKEENIKKQIEKIQRQIQEMKNQQKGETEKIQKKEKRKPQEDLGKNVDVYA